MAYLNLTAIGAATSTVVISNTPGEQTHVMVEFMSGAIQRLQVNNTQGQGTPGVCYFDEQCVPENPFYLRWINRKGGWDYQMFACTQGFTRKSTSVTTYMPYLEENEANPYPIGAPVLFREGVIDIDPELTIECGATWEGKDDFDKLSLMIYSPKVQWWNEEIQAWLGVYLNKHSVMRQTKTWLGTIELEIIMPKPIVQF